MMYYWADLGWALALLAYAVLLVATLRNVGKNGSISSNSKWLWALVIVVFPILGIAVWFLTSESRVQNQPS